MLALVKSMRALAVSGLAAVLAAIAAVGVAPQAQAGPEYSSAFDLTLDVTVSGGSTSLVGEPHWINPISPPPFLRASLSAPPGKDVRFSVEAGTEIGVCFMAPTDTYCDAGVDFSSLIPGENVVSYRFRYTDNSAEEILSGRIFVLDDQPPTVTAEIRDAAGTWIDASGPDLPLLASMDTELRCVVVNNANAPASVNGFWSLTLSPAGSDSGTITGTIAPGETLYTTVYTGPASGIAGYGCSAPITYPDGAGSNGAGMGAGFVHVDGTLSASPLSIAPGESVTVSGVGLDRTEATYTVTVDGVEVAGSPITPTPGDFSLSVPFPDPGTYTLAFLNSETIGGRDVTIAYAVFTVTVAAQSGSGDTLADTGVDAAAVRTVGIAAAALVLTGAAVLVLRRRAR